MIESSRQSHSILGKFINRARNRIDWILFFAMLPILGAGLVTMNSFSGNSTYFEHQLIWIPLACFIFFILSQLDLSFLKRTTVLITLFLLSCGILILLFGIGHI